MSKHSAEQPVDCCKGPKHSQKALQGPCKTDIDLAEPISAWNVRCTSAAHEYSFCTGKLESKNDKAMDRNATNDSLIAQLHNLQLKAEFLDKGTQNRNQGKSREKTSENCSYYSCLWRVKLLKTACAFYLYPILNDSN